MVRSKKRFMTLIEITIVMFLITLIAGVVTYKVKDSLDYGKAFKTHQGIVQVRQILEMAVAKDPRRYKEIEREWQKYVEHSPLAANPSALMVDGWGEPYKVTIEGRGRMRVQVVSEAFDEYKKKHTVLFEEESETPLSP